MTLDVARDLAAPRKADHEGDRTMTRVHFTAADLRQVLHRTADRAEDLIEGHSDVAATLWFNARLFDVGRPAAPSPPPAPPTAPDPAPDPEPALDAAAIRRTRRLRRGRAGRTAAQAMRTEAGVLPMGPVVARARPADSRHAAAAGTH